MHVRQLEESVGKVEVRVGQLEESIGNLEDRISGLEEKVSEIDETLKGYDIRLNSLENNGQILLENQHEILDNIRTLVQENWEHKKELLKEKRRAGME
ncbi:hypothetical protein [Rossellomorea sp. BNER]|uniref:hypothetical protein n=1 Tax=Rossellomorea sp. BNER TaxID=2962031 RepID=UPI003AF26673|nr:hypothetical protein [Rossellomorea sp. BNER]